MRNISQIINLVVDGEVTTQEQAAAIIEEEVIDRRTICNLSATEIRDVLLSNLGYATGYMSHEKGDRIMQLFNTEHPIWGRTHPTPEEALRLGMEYGERARKHKENDGD